MYNSNSILHPTLTYSTIAWPREVYKSSTIHDFVVTLNMETNERLKDSIVFT